MKQRFITTKNYMHLKEAILDTYALPDDVPKLILAYGHFGISKSMSSERLAAEFPDLVVWLRALEVWSKKSALLNIAEAIGLSIEGGTSRVFLNIVDELTVRPRIFIIDEVDTLLQPDKASVMNMIRDLSDSARRSVWCFVGMESSDAKFKRITHHYSRIVRFVRFEQVEKEALRQLCELSDCKLEEKLVEHIVATYPNMRHVATLVAEIDRVAKTNDITEVTLSVFNEWRLDNAAKKTQNRV